MGFFLHHEDLRLGEEEETPDVDSKEGSEKGCTNFTRERPRSGKPDGEELELDEGCLITLLLCREDEFDVEGTDGETWSLIPSEREEDPDPQWKYVWRPELATDPSLFRYDTSKLEYDPCKLV